MSKFTVLAIPAGLVALVILLCVAVCICKRYRDAIAENSTLKLANLRLQTALCEQVERLQLDDNASLTQNFD